MTDVDVAVLYKQYFNCNESYVLDYIMKFEDKFRLTSIYNSRTHAASGFITEPNELYRVYVSSENDLKDISRGFFTLSDVDKFDEFSDLIKDLIYKLTRKRDPDKDPYKDDYYFATDDDTRIDDDLNRFANEFCKYVKPNSTEARMIIQWLVLFKVCYINSIDLEDIKDFYFAYDTSKEYFHLFVWIKNQSKPRYFVFEKSPRDKSILDVFYWNEKDWNEEEATSKLKTFDLPLTTAVSEINKFRSNYISIIVKGEDKYTDYEDEFRDIFKVIVNSESEINNNLEHLEIDDNSEYTTSTKFDNFAEDLKDIITNITNASERNSEWFFISNNDHHEDYVSHFLNTPLTKYYKPRIVESRVAVAWILVYKLCKMYDLDRTEIENLTFYYYPRKNFLRIVITIDGKEHKFGMPHAKDRNILDMFWWHNCTGCNADGSGCIYTDEDEEDDTDTTNSDSKEKAKDESIDSTPFSDFLKKRLVDKWDKAKNYYVQIEGDAFHSNFVAHAVIPLDYIPEEEYNKINDIILEIYKLSGQMPIFTAYPKDYCDNYVSHKSFSRFDDDVLVDYDTIESADTTSLMIILAALEYHWMTKGDILKWDSSDHFIINKTTSDAFYKQGFSRMYHAVINENNRIVEWYVPGSKDDKNINQNGVITMDSLARIKPAEQKSDKRKKMLKLMLISQMLNSQK